MFLSGYLIKPERFVKTDFSYKKWLVTREGRLLIPFIVWSVYYSIFTIIPDLIYGRKVEWTNILYKLLVGKAATPFYYILVLIQLTIITPMLIRIITNKYTLEKVLWFVTPAYLIYVYVWNFLKGNPPMFYETFFPAWFGFYYLGIQIRGNIVYVIGTMIFSCIEAFGLRYFGLSSSFYISQITLGAFLYSSALIGLIIKWASYEKHYNESIVRKIGDCSYGIFYIHMFVLAMVERILDKISKEWFFYWVIRFILVISISYLIVKTVQVVLYSRTRILKYIGFL